MNYSLVRQERIAKLEAKLSRIAYALKNYRYSKPAQYLEDLAAFETTVKELEIQEAYLNLELAYSGLNVLKESFNKFFKHEA